MSNYQGYALNPSSGYVERASFVDNYYGGHLYGVAFSDTQVYPQRNVLTFDANTWDVDISYSNVFRVFYKDFVCTIEFREGVCHGKVDNCNELISATASNLSSICEEMVMAIDDYLMVN